MNETKGLVMKVTDGYMVVMCDDGRFRNLPLPKRVPGVGERIVVPLQEKKRFSINFHWVSAAAVLIIFLVGSSLWLQLRVKAYHLMAIDINPSLELYLGSEGHVIRAKPLNKDAEDLLNALQLDKLPVSEAIPQLIQKSVALGYITNDAKSLIMVSVVKLREGASEISPGYLEDLVDKTLQAEDLNGYLKLELADEALYKESKEKNLSLNKLILAQQAEERGFHLYFDHAGSKPVQSVLDEAGARVEQFFVPVGAIPKEPASPAVKEPQEGKRENGEPWPVQPEGSKRGAGYYENPTQEGKSTGSTPSSHASENTYPGSPGGTSGSSTSGEGSSLSEPATQPYHDGSQAPADSTTTNTEPMATEPDSTLKPATSDSQPMESNSGSTPSGSGWGGR